MFEKATSINDAQCRTAIVALEGVSRTYKGPPSISALKTTSLSIHSGDHLAIMGRSGSGKSTLMNIVGLIDRVSDGRVLFEGVDVSEISDNELSTIRGSRVGFVFQAFNLLESKSVLDNTALAMVYARRNEREVRRELAAEALSRVGLGHRMFANPSTLSGGERQRAAIARAIVGAPALLLCDEPTGSLDSHSAASVLNLIDDLHDSGHTVVVITHDPLVAKHANRLLEIEDGCVQEVMKSEASDSSDE